MVANPAEFPKNSPELSAEQGNVPGFLTHVVVEVVDLGTSCALGLMRLLPSPFPVGIIPTFPGIVPIPLLFQ